METYTKVPNAILDNLHHMSSAEIAVVLVVIRQTVGYQKEWDKISISQFINTTGNHRQTILNGLADAEQHGIIERKKAGNSFQYRVKSVQNLDQQNERSVHNLDRFGTETRPIESVNGTENVPNTNQNGTEFRPKTVQNLDTLKKKENMIIKDDGGEVFSVLEKAGVFVSPLLAEQYHELIDELTAAAVIEGIKIATGTNKQHSIKYIASCARNYKNGTGPIIPAANDTKAVQTINFGANPW